jgi:hypothetical protein
LSSSPSTAAKQGACLGTIISFLLPYVADAAADLRDARTEVIETLISYRARTRTEFLQAAQIIALSMTTLEVLYEAKTTEMSPAMRIRHRGNANSLNRAAVQTQKALDQSLAREIPERPSPPAAPEPIDDTTDADCQAMVQQARSVVEAYRNRFATNGAQPAPHQHGTGQSTARPDTPGSAIPHRQALTTGP